MNDNNIAEEIKTLKRIVAEQKMTIDTLCERINEVEVVKNHFPSVNTTGKKKYANPASYESDEKLLMRLKLLINETQLYKSHDVKFWKVAAELNVTQKRLKEIVVSTKYHNLKNILNHYRVLAACQTIIQYPAYSIQAVAADSGFNSLKSFYRWFQREVGSSPTDYRNSIMEGKSKGDDKPQ